ncbi:MAG TPA: hypothetical protein VF984_08595 [Actinomycetota bacterium]
MRGRFATAAVLALALAATACGRVAGPGGGGSDSIEHPTGSDRLVLRAETGGGFVAPAYELRRIPDFSLFGDGRLVTEGPVVEIYPGPALPNVLVRTVSEDGIQAVLEAAKGAGLFGPDAHYDFPCIADAPTTTFTVYAEGIRHEVSAYALGEGQATCSGADVEARSKLAAFERKLTDLQSWLPQGSLGAEGPFDPAAMRAYVQPYAQAPDPGLEQQVVDWPLGGPLATFGEPDPNLPDTRCGVVSGSDLQTLLPLAEKASELTPWRSAGTDYSLLFRPLLPDESGC